MSASPFVHTEVRQDRSSTAPITVDSSEHTPVLTGLASRIPAAWIGMTGYLVAGVLIGLVLIVAISLTRGDSDKVAAGTVTDNVVHLSAAQIGDTCWKGAAKSGAARITVSMEVGLDGKVRSAIASGESPSMRSCVESHVRSWEFLPQAAPAQMVLPFEIDAR